MVKQEVCGRLWKRGREVYSSFFLEAALLVWYGLDGAEHEEPCCTDDRCRCYAAGVEQGREFALEDYEPMRNESRD